MPRRDRHFVTAPELAVAAIVAFLLVPSPVRAYEDQITLGLDVGAGLAISSDFGVAGPQLGVTVGWGWSDAWVLQGRASYALHPGSPDIHVPIVGVETLYVLDILQLVPLIGIGTDVLAAASAPGTEWHWAIHAMIGFDWLINREWIVGFDYRVYLLPVDFDEGISPWYMSFGVRATMVFERY